MALRYWVGGTANWDATAGTKWALTSAGAGGQAVPNQIDDVFLDGASGNVTITKSAAGNCKSLNCNGFTGILNGSYALSIFGACNFTGMTGTFGGTGGLVMRGGAYGLTLSSSMIWSCTGVLSLNYSAVTTLNTNGIVLPCNIVIQGAAGLTLASDLEITHASGLTFTGGGVLRAITYNLKCTVISGSVFSLYMGSGTWEITGASANTNPWNMGSNVNMYKETSTLKITDSFSHAIGITLSPSFSGLVYNNITISRGANTYNVTFVGIATINVFKDEGTEAHSLIFTAGKTYTFNQFLVSGSSGKLIKITSTSTSIHTLVIAGGEIVSSDYLDIQHSVASPASTWYAGEHSTDNNSVATAGSGWFFTTPPSPTKSYLGFF